MELREAIQGSTCTAFCHAGLNLSSCHFIVGKIKVSYIYADIPVAVSRVAVRLGYKAQPEDVHKNPLKLG